DGYKHKIKFETVSPDDPDLHYYLAQDCIYTRLIHKHHNVMMNKQENAHSYKLYKTVLLKASWALLRLEENGFFVREEYAKALEKDYGTKLNNAEVALVQLANDAGFTPQGFVAWSGQKAIPTAFKCGAPKQLAYVLIGLLGLPKYKGKVSTDADTMLHWLFNTLDFPIKNEYEFADASEETVNNWIENTLDAKMKNAKKFLWELIAYRKLKKMYSTYILNAVEYSKDDGRVHVTYKIQGTVTGRLSSGDPMNLQNIPRKKDIKCIFGAPEGKTLIECDYSQAELRVLAYLSQDPDMLETYKNDGDLHDAVATKMFGPNFNKEQRVGAKTVNFGLAYGRGKSSVAEQLRCSYQFASDLVDQWHASMPVASRFITATRAKPK
ncbi:MAG: DNA polymerase, partial [Cetobacterium sp.]